MSGAVDDIRWRFALVSHRGTENTEFLFLQRIAEDTGFGASHYAMEVTECLRVVHGDKMVKVQSGWLCGLCCEARSAGACGLSLT